MVESNNQRLAKNTLLLYIRTFLVLFLSLYITRLVLQALGERDLGIYNVVGGIVVMLSFVQSSLTITIGRFITFELGRDPSSDNMSKICSICITILMIAGLIIFVISEFAGVYIIEEWTTIPQERMLAAHVVYQFSLLIFLVQMQRVPFDSIVIAHEKMSFYAYMSIFETILKLLAVVLLLKTRSDRLIAYVGLLFLITIILFCCYYYYVKKYYNHCRLHWMWDRKVSYSIMMFSGWSVLGSATNTATQQGVNLLLNNFVGLVANTAMGFTNQVVQAVNVFVSSFTTAFNPQVTKYYAAGEQQNLQLLMCRASKFSFVLAFFIACPMIINMDYLLSIWLKDVPQYTTDFCRLVLVCAIIDATTGVYNTAITASGKIKKYQICISISFLIDLIISYFLLINGIYPAFVFVSRIITRGFLNMGVGLYFSYREVSFNLQDYFRQVLQPIILILLFMAPFAWGCEMLESGVLKLLITSLLIFVSVPFLTYFLFLTSAERLVLKSYMQTTVFHFKKNIKV